MLWAGCSLRNSLERFVHVADGRAWIAYQLIERLHQRCGLPARAVVFRLQLVEAELDAILLRRFGAEPVAPVDHGMHREPGVSINRHSYASKGSNRGDGFAQP